MAYWGVKLVYALSPPIYVAPIPLIMALATACSGGFPEASDVDRHAIGAPIGNYSGKAWIRPDLLVVAYNPDKVGLGQPIRLWTVDLENGKLELMPISKDDPDCRLTEYGVPTTLPDGRLGFVKSCTPINQDEPPEFSVLAYDLKAGQLQSLGPLLDFSPRQFDWNPAAGRGILAKSNSICATIAWFTSDGLKYLSAQIEDQAGTFRLDDGYTDEDSDCSSGRADWPTWSPDGSEVAFFASPRSVGVEGMARLSEPWNLYLMHPEEQRPRKVLENVMDPLGVRWSPDSQWLALSGELADGRRGTWLYKTKTERLVRISEEILGPPAWSPDGTRIVGLLGQGDVFPPARELVVLDVADIVRGE